MSQIEVEQNFYGYRVKFDGILHLYLRKDIVGITSWYDDQSTYTIEFTFESGATTKVEYHIRELWLTVLKEFDKLLR